MSSYPKTIYHITKDGTKFRLSESRWCPQSRSYLNNGFCGKEYQTKKSLILDNWHLVQQSRLYDWSKNGWFAL